MKSRRSSEFNFWPSIADMILAILMTFLILWFVQQSIFKKELATTEKGINSLSEDFEKCKIKVEETNSEAQNYQESLEMKERDNKNLFRQLVQSKGEQKNCQESLDDSLRTIGNCEEQLKKCQDEFQCDKPTIITLNELSGYKFETGKANLSSDFEENLKAKIGDIKQGINKYKANVIEVIGHTDGQVAGGQKSDLDYSLEKIVAGSLPVENLRYGSNADLGLMRALSVVLFLRQQPELEGIKFRVYSAAQLILPDGELAVEQERESDEQRRRIELRFTQL